MSSTTSDYWICSACVQLAGPGHTCGKTSSTSAPFSGGTITTTTGYCSACDSKTREIASLEARLAEAQRRIDLRGSLIDSLQKLIRQLGT